MFSNTLFSQNYGNSYAYSYSPTTNTFKPHLDQFWENQMYNPIGKLTYCLPQVIIKLINLF